jgi:hypothetical protein
MDNQEEQLFYELLIKNAEKVSPEMAKAVKAATIKSLLSREIDVLFKARKAQLEQMIGPDATAPHHQEAIKEIKTLFPKSDHDVWLTKHYKKNPSILKENRDSLRHISDQMKIHDDLRLHNVKDMPFKEGLESLLSKERELSNKKAMELKSHYYKPSSQTTKITDLADGRSWFNINKGGCSKLGSLLGHCGNGDNGHHPDDRLHYLAKEHNDASGDALHEPSTVFIENNGYIGEMKGRHNFKPGKEDHDAIVEYLKRPEVKGIIGGGYQSHENFEFSDLTPEQRKEILSKKPNIDTLNTEKTLDSRHFPEAHIEAIEKHNRAVNAMKNHDWSVDKLVKSHLADPNHNRSSDIASAIDHPFFKKLFNKKHLEDLLEKELAKKN